jgi:hypothetical protein
MLKNKFKTMNKIKDFGEFLNEKKSEVKKQIDRKSVMIKALRKDKKNLQKKQTEDIHKMDIRIDHAEADKENLKQKRRKELHKS